MIKRSSRVLSMVMAFSMAASVFVAPNAFAATFSSTANDVRKSRVTATFLEKNANGVYEGRNNGNTGSEVFATVACKKAGAEDTATDFVIGDDYTVTITQATAQAAKYTISSAKIGVDLKTSETDGSAYYNEYVEDVALTKSTSGGNTVYTGSFTAFGAANTALSSGVSALKLYIDVETKTSTVIAKAGADSKNAEVTPLDADLNKTDSVALKAGQDAYFRVTPSSSSYYIESDAVKATPYLENGTAVTGSSVKNLTLDTTKGLDIYKLAAADVTALINSAENKGTVYINVAAAAKSKTHTFSFSNTTLANRYKVTIADSGTVVTSGDTVYAGTKLTITDSKGGYIYGITSSPGSISSYCPGSSTASFIMPDENLTISGVSSTETSSTSYTLSLKSGNAIISEGAGSVSALTGSVKQVTFKPINGTIYPDLTNSEEYKISYTNNGWKFDFLGVKDGNLVYDVTFGTQNLDLGFATDGSGLRYPSVSTKFVPALKFDQMLYSDKPNIKLTALGSSATDTTGVVTVGVQTSVVVDYNNVDATMDYIDLAGSKLTTSGKNKITVSGEKATAAFTMVKSVDENGKGLLLDFDADYKLGNVEIDEADNGTLIATNGYSNRESIERAKAGSVVYLVVTPKTGYKLDSITVKENALDGKTLTLTKLTDNVYTVKMPTTNKVETDGINKDYGISVKAKATFVKDSSVAAVKNLAPEADKAKNNGYAKASFGTASQIKVGEEFNVEYIANDNCKLLSTAVQYTNTSGKTVTLEATKVDGNKYTYKAPSDVEDAISIGAKFAKTSDIIKVENKTAEADKETNNGYLTIKEAEVVAGGTITGTATAVEGYKVASVSYSYTDSDKKTVTKDVTVEENAFSITVPKDVVAEGTISISAKFEKSGEEAAKNAWVKDGDNWTYWKDGKQVTGWFQDGGIDWFYADVKTGFMKTGWFQDGGDEWFYADVKTGAMKTGWFQDGGSTWYYCFTQEDAVKRGNRAGVMATNQWVLSNEKWYYLNNTGAMETNNWVKDADDALESWVGEDGAFVPAE